MGGEYVHPTNPYEQYESFLHYVQQLQLLPNNEPQADVAASQAPHDAPNVSSSDAATTSGSSLTLYYLASIILILLILHAIFWVAQKLYVRHLNNISVIVDGTGAVRANTKSSYSAAVVHYFACLAPSHSIITDSNRVAAVSGFILGLLCLVLFQFLISPAVMQHIQGGQSVAVSEAGGATAMTPQHDLTGFRRDTSSSSSLPSTSHCSQHKCPEISACTHDESKALIAGQPPCVSLMELPENQPPLHQQTSYSPLKLYSIDCMDGDWINNGKWTLRSSESSPSSSSSDWIKVDRWGMFGAQGRPGVDNKYIWNPPQECSPTSGKQGSFRRFNAKKFLKAIEGKTISFLGDSMNRQMFGMLTVLLNDHIIGNSLYYTREARHPNPVREYYFQHNVTMKNQWLMGHQGSDALLKEVFPTLWRSDLMVFNIGAFFQEGADSRLQDTLEKFLEYADKHYQGSMMWREYSPTHFNTPDGEFDMLRRRDPVLNQCIPFDLQKAIAENPKDVAARYGNYRLKVANEVMKKHSIAILPVFNVSVVVPEADLLHRGSSDCRHWYQPSAVLEHWCDVLYNMIVPPESD